MKLQPFGPVEQAIQKSASPELPQTKTLKYFIGGVGFTLVAVAIAWTIVSYKKRKKENEQGEKTMQSESSTLS